MGRYVIRGVSSACQSTCRRWTVPPCPCPGAVSAIGCWSNPRSLVKNRCLTMAPATSSKCCLCCVARRACVLRRVCARLPLRTAHELLKSVTVIVRNDVLEHRPTNIARFKQLVETQADQPIGRGRRDCCKARRSVRTLEVALPRRANPPRGRDYRPPRRTALSNAAHEMPTGQKV